MSPTMMTVRTNSANSSCRPTHTNCSAHDALIPGRGHLIPNEGAAHALPMGPRRLPNTDWVVRRARALRFSVLNEDERDPELKCPGAGSAGCPCSFGRLGTRFNAQCYPLR